MAVKISESGNIVYDLRKIMKQGKKPQIYIALFETSSDMSLLKNVLESVDLSITGIIVDDDLLKCRNNSLHEKIKLFNTTCGLEVCAFDRIKTQNDAEENIVIVKNKYTFIQKIINVLERAEANCTLYHINDLKHTIAEVDETNGHLPAESNCSGCGACANICPTQAISMEYSNHNFLVPFIDKVKCVNCNLCTNTCPSLNPVFKNKKEPKFYSFCANDEIRKESSSGGMFTLLAQYVLRQKGYVCGASYDEELNLRHCIINEEKDIGKFRGSKYFQSNMGSCYKDIKALLTDDKYVLFTGTPCQIAGIKAYLKKDYDKLITAEVLCHGVPSQKFFDSYLEEVSQGRRIKNVEFRSKRLGWSFSGMIFYFEDGTELISKRKSPTKNVYLDAFIDNMMMRDMCYDCVFNDYPRQADFTIGDLWHSEKLDPKSNDKKGTSFVFLNNEKAERVYNVIAAEAKYHKLLTVADYTKIPNRVSPKTKISPYRERFLDLLKTKPFSEAYEYAVNGYYDIGMPCVMYNDNIGSVLTYYALYNTLTDMKYAVLPIERPLDAPLAVSEEAIAFNQRWLPDYAQPIRYKNILEMRALNKKCKQFALGSDQLFLESMSASRNHFFFMQWAEEKKKRIAYATSFGGAGARGTKEFYRQLEYYLNKFDFISCRENDGVDFANSNLQLNTKVEWCIDPVFLCDKAHYMKLVEFADVERTSEYIGAYVIIPRVSINKLITKTREQFGELSVEVLGNQEKADKVKGFTYSCINPFPIERALELICHSKYFITDSFHGVCFAIIFRKDFLVIPRDFVDRFETLLGKLGLEDRIVSNDLANFTPELYQPIDYDAVYEKLHREIENSRKMLLEALEGGELNDILSDVDVVMNYVEEHSKEIARLADADVETETMLKTVLEKLASIEERINKLELAKGQE